MDSHSRTNKVLCEVAEERGRQILKWGIQHHRDGTDTSLKSLCDLVRLCNDSISDKITWHDILMEELLEAASESDQLKLRTELVQVAAVAVAWIEDIDQRESGSPTAA